MKSSCRSNYSRHLPLFPIFNMFRAGSWLMGLYSKGLRVFNQPCWRMCCWFLNLHAVAESKAKNWFLGTFIKSNGGFSWYWLGWTSLLLVLLNNFNFNFTTSDPSNDSFWAAANHELYWHGYLPVCMMCEVWKSHASSLVNTQGRLCYWWLVMDNRYTHVAVSCEGLPSPCDSTYRVQTHSENRCTGFRWALILCFILHVDSKDESIKHSW